MIKEKKYLAISSLLAIIFAICCSALAFNCSMNYDEFFSVNWTELSWKEMISALKTDVHPPLYYIGLKCWKLLTGPQVINARFFSFIPFLGILLGGNFWVNKRFGGKSALWYVLFLCGNPFMFQKAVEIRMYCWTSFWVLLNGVCFYEIAVCGKKKKIVYPLFFLSGLLAAYNHYFGILAMVFTYLGLGILNAVRKEKKGLLCWLAGCAMTVAGYLPWFFVALKQIGKVNNNYWIEKPQSRMGVIRELFYSAIPYSEKPYVFLLMLLPALSLLWLFWRKKGSYWWSFVGGAVIWGVWLLGIFYMYGTGRPILTSRYLIPAILLAILASCLTVKEIPFYLLVPFMCLFLATGQDAYQGLYSLQMQRTTEKFVQYAQEYIDTADVVYYLDDGYGYLKACLDYYVPEIECFELKAGELPEKDSPGKIWFIDSERVDQDVRNAVIEGGGYGLNGELSIWHGKVYAVLWGLML